mgnify:FL=1
MSNNTKILIAGVVLIIIVLFIFSEDVMKLFGEDPEGGDGTTPVNTAIIGCMDSSAENFNPLATQGGDRENACFYNWGCCDVHAVNYDATADSCWQDGSNSILCDYGAGYGVTDPPATNSIAILDQTQTYTYTDDNGQTVTLDPHSPNDCSCANLNAFALLGCLQANAEGTILDPPLCVGTYWDAQYCNSDEYNTNGFDNDDDGTPDDCGMFGCTCLAELP